MGMLSREEIEAMGFAEVGSQVQISDKASFYGTSRIRLGSHVRIDDFCVLSAGVGGVVIGSYVHVGVSSSLIGAGRIALSDYCNISSKVSIYSSNDDYSGESMTNPMIPSSFTNVTHADVLIGRHVIIGSGSVVLPGITLEDGVAIGALSLVNRNCDYFSVYAGSPIRYLKERSKSLLALEEEFRRT